MRSFPNDDLDPAQYRRRPAAADLRRQRRTPSIHALREIAKHTRGGMQIRWRLDGFVVPAAARPACPRNHLGFKDGIANPDVADPASPTGCCG